MLLIKAYAFAAIETTAEGLGWGQDKWGNRERAQVVQAAAAMFSFLHGLFTLEAVFFFCHNLLSASLVLVYPKWVSLDEKYPNALHTAFAQSEEKIKISSPALTVLFAH